MSLTSKKKGITSVICFVNCKKNNTFITITSDDGSVLFSMSCGFNFKGSVKSTAFAGESIVFNIFEKWITLQKIKPQSLSK